MTSTTIYDARNRTQPRAQSTTDRDLLYLRSMMAQSLDLIYIGDQVAFRTEDICKDNMLGTVIRLQEQSNGSPNTERMDYIIGCTDGNEYTIEYHRLKKKRQFPANTLLERLILETNGEFEQSFLPKKGKRL